MSDAKIQTDDGTIDAYLSEPEGKGRVPRRDRDPRGPRAY